jgi:two-component system response regulator HydG
MKPTILVIDDEESIRFTFKTFLSNQGHEVLTAEDYHSAMDIISNRSLDLIFADIILGDHTGVDLLREVKEKGLTCPVVMITGEPNIGTAAESVRLGAFDYLPKPVTKETILRVTKIALNHKALADEKVLVEKEKDRYREHLEAILRSVKDAIIAMDNEMRVTEANKAVEVVCGMVPAEIIGKPFHEMIPQYLSPCSNILKESLENQKVIREYRIERKQHNRTRQVLVVTASPLLDHDNRSIGAILVIRDVTRLAALERELRERHRFHNLIGRSKKMQEIYRLLEDLTEVDTTVLITGESGTGKEIIAKALHQCGPRAFEPLISVNCSALSENLLESELFGHEKGSFTGAVKDKQGRFEAADGGIIFLDEIGDISPVIQLKLLRVLQEKEFERVGDSNPIKVDVRVIAATNRNLREQVRQGNFREDLFYRLKVLEITMPPLRDRLEDVPLFINHFIDRFNNRFKKNIQGITNEVLRVFMGYSWPGNVRELEHAIEHAFVLCHDEAITLDHIPSEISQYSKVKIESLRKDRSVSHQDLLEALEKTGRNKSKAARLLGISRQTLYRQINKHKITQPSEPSSSVTDV